MQSETRPTQPRKCARPACKPFTQMLVLAALALCALAPPGQAALVTGTITFYGLALVNNGSGGNETAVDSWGAVTNYGGSGSFATVPAVGAAISFAPGIWKFGQSTAIPNFWTAGGFSFELVNSSVTIDEQNFELVGFGNAVISGNGYTPTVCSGYFQFTDPTVGGYTPVNFSCTSSGVSAVPVQPVLSLTTISKKQILTWTDSSYSLQCSPGLTNTFTNLPNATSPYTNTFTTPSRFFRLTQ